MSLSVIVASCGRATLERTRESIWSQLVGGDEILVDINRDSPGGGRARNRQMALAEGDWLCFCDDDDIWAPDAAKHIRAGVMEAPGRPHIFRMQRKNDTLWREPVLKYGNVGTPMIVVPNGPLGRWGETYGRDDWAFITSTVEILGDPVWHTDVIALIRPT